MSLDDSFMLKMNKKLKSHDTVSDSSKHSSVDDIGLPTPLRAEWGSELGGARQSIMNANWDLPSITLAMKDTAAAVQMII